MLQPTLWKLLIYTVIAVILKKSPIRNRISTSTWFSRSVADGTHLTSIVV